jgi:hypothetical protein
VPFETHLHCVTPGLSVANISKHASRMLHI